jgi:succinate-semialdehyde dehydrogenase/glutarate-semialdehyde dehydrogenase
MTAEAQAVLNKTVVVDTNPATGEVLAELPCASAEEVHTVVRRAREAQAQWQATPLAKRIDILRRFQGVLRDHTRDVAQLICREAGKPTVEAISTEVLVVLDATEFCVRTAHRFLREQPVPHGNIAMKTKRGVLVREPYGVIGIISPWNYPFSTPAVETVAALVMGNAVVIKPSEFTPLAALELQKLMHSAGLDPDLLQVVVGDGLTGAALIDSGVDKLIFTGSVATGKRVAEAAARRLLPVVLELGGKDPMIVLPDVDLEVTTSGALWGAFMNAGQTCLSVERCYVHRSIYEAFLKKMTEKIGRMRVGNGLDSEVEMGPLINERQLRTVEAHVDEAVQSGARLLAGGRRLTELGPNFYAPTLLADVTPEMRVIKEETFGPVLPVAAFDTETEAIALANSGEFGLAASVWTRNRAQGEAIARQIKAGTVMVNDMISCFGISEAPHGGLKQSGIGRTHGEMGLAEMVQVKYIDSDLLPNMRKVWWYGYGGQFQRQIEAMVQMTFGRGIAAKLRGAIGSIGALRRNSRI